MKIFALHRLIKNPVFKMLFFMISGSFFAQIITFLTVPVMTRLYLPEEVGEYMMFLSIIAVCSPILNGRYDLSIVVEKDQVKSYALMKLSVLISLISTSVISLIYFIYKFIFCKNEFLEMLKYTFLLWIFLLVFSGINILTSYNNKNQDYEIITISNLKRAFVQNILMCIFGIYNPCGGLLIISYLIGLFYGVKMQAASLLNKINLIINTSMKEVKFVFFKYVGQLIYSSPAQLLNGISYSILVFFIQSLYGLSQLGYYSISIRVLGFPLTLISSNLSKIYFEKAIAELEINLNYHSIARKTVVFLLLISIPVFLVIYFTIDFICIKFLGESWTVAATYIKILLPMYVIRFIVSSISPGFMISNMQNRELILQFMFILSSLLVFLYCNLYSYSIEVFLSLINLCYFIIYFIGLYYLMKLSKKGRKSKNG